MAAIAMLLGSACFSADLNTGLTCSESGQCPSGQTCVENVCVGGDIQAPVPDGSSVDSGLSPDAGAPDAELCVAGTQTFDFTGTIESFTVPGCVTSITIEVFGAQGGGGRNNLEAGGKGARMKGDFAVLGADTLQILVGERGRDAVVGQSLLLEQGGGTGGGGSFVVAADDTALIVAGGGGGATDNQNLALGQDGRIESSGGRNGGSDGAGGVTNSNGGFHGGTGGGGLLGDGVNNSVGNGDFGSSNSPGSSFVNGGAGGVGGSRGRNGGFGGGGSAGYVGGGGGGYSGGGAGATGPVVSGGGGGSINAGMNQDNSPGVQTGNGQIILTW